MVYILSKSGKPLMPTKRYGKVRRLLKEGKVKVVQRKPFTVQLTYDTKNHTQNITLGINSGYQDIGFSGITDKEELISGELKMLKNMSERFKKCRMYRLQRRSRLRFRQPRFNNRRRSEGWLAPSINHKFETHIRLVEQIKKILPITEVIIEVANFDIQKIKNPDIKGEQYQQGEQLEYWNLREYILHRDNHKCQNPNCKNKLKEKVLEVHHVGYWKNDRTDRPSNLTTLCTICNIPRNHQEKGFLYGWQPKLKSFKGATFMTTIRWKLVNLLNCKHTYGFITKKKRIELCLEKSHSTDAFIIAGGTNQKRSNPFTMEQIKRNNRSLELFYDAKYIDIRTRKKASGKNLDCGRHTRNKNHNTESLRKYRGEKVSKGRHSIRRRRYFYQPKDLVRMGKKIYSVKGIHSLGNYIKLVDLNKSVKSVKTELVKPFQFKKGLCYT